MNAYTCLVFGTQRTCLCVEVITTTDTHVHDAAEHFAMNVPGAVGYEVWLQGRKVISHFDSPLPDDFCPGSSELASRTSGEHVTPRKR